MRFLRSPLFTDFPVSSFPMAYADALSVATAIRAEAAVVTGDPEFRQVEHFVAIDWH